MQTQPLGGGCQSQTKQVGGDVAQVDRQKQRIEKSRARGHSESSKLETVQNPETHKAVEKLNKEYGSLFAKIRDAHENPLKWDRITTPDSQHPKIQKRNQLFRKLIARIQFHMLGALGGEPAPIHVAIIEEISKQTNISLVELEETAYLNVKSKTLGTWKPLSARMSRLANDVESTDNRVLGSLEKINKKVTPPVGEIHERTPIIGLEELIAAAKDKKLGKAAGIAVREILTTPLKVFHELWGALLPVAHAVGQPTAEALKRAAVRLEKVGNERRDEAQNMFRELNRALAHIQSSPNKLKDVSPEERELILLAAGAMRGAVEDVDTWLDLLRNPSDRENPELVGKVVKKTTGWDAASWLLNNLGGFIRTITDKDAGGLFSFRLGVGVAAGAMGHGVKLSGALIFPCSKEYKNGTAAIRTDVIYSLLTLFGRAQLSSRGPRIGFPSFGPFYVRKSEYCNAVTFKNELLFPLGVSFQTDTQLPAGLDLALYVPFLGLKVGGELTLYHPGFGGFRHAVDPTAELLAAAGNSIANFLTATGKSMRLAMLKASTAHPETKGLPQERLEKLLPERLGPSATVVGHAHIALATVRAYREELAVFGAGVLKEQSPVYESLVSGFGRERAISVIEQFLATKEKELVADIDRVKNLLMEPTSDQWAERSLRGEINEAGRSLKRTTEGFRIGDILLGQVFGTKLTESVGHNTETMLQELGEKIIEGAESREKPRTKDKVPGRPLSVSEWQTRRNRANVGHHVIRRHNFGFR